MTKTVMALYDDFTTAQKAVQDLIDGGFPRDDISLIRRDADRDAVERAPGTMADEDGGEVATGAGVGAAVGGIGGLLVGLGALAIPGVGPAIAAGPLAAAIIGAGTGAVAGGLIGALTDLGVPEEEAGYYAEGLRRGGTLVAVRTDDADASRAADILERNDPVDVESRAGLWRESGWTGFAAEAEPYAAGDLEQERKGILEQEPKGIADREAHIPVVEEDVRVGRREVERGGVRVRSYVVERPIDETVQLRDETVRVERRPADRSVTAAEADQAFEETWVEVKETDEEAVVSKEARVVEEVVVGKDVETREEHVRDKVRRTEVEVENISGTAPKDQAASSKP